MIRSLVMSSVIALIPGLALAADTNTSAPSTTTVVTHPADAAAQTGASVKTDAAKTDAKVVAKGKAGHKADKAKVMPKTDAPKS